MFLDIVILPPPEVRRQVGRVTVAVAKKYKLLMRVDNKKLIPHISLYHLLVSKKRLNALMSHLEKMLSQYRVFRLRFGKVRGGRLYFGVNCLKNNRLARLHRRVVLGLSRFRSGSPALPGPVRLKPSEKKLRKKYGVFAILKYFWPHITYGRMKHATDAPRVFRFANRYKLNNFKADTVAVALVDREWQVTKILKTFKLKSS